MQTIEERKRTRIKILIDEFITPFLYNYDLAIVPLEKIKNSYYSNYKINM